MRTIVNIVLKELKELLTIQMMIPFVMAMVIFVLVGRVMRGETQKAKQPQTVLVADFDSSDVSRTVIDALKAESITVVEAAGSREQLLALLRESGYSWLVVIPESLGRRVAGLETGEVEVYNLIRGFSLSSAMRGLKLKTVIDKVNAQIARSYLAQAYPAQKVENLQVPLRQREYVVVKGKMAEGNAQLLEGLMFSQTLLIPIVLLMVIIYASQMIAASIGQEKENKTLETLLTVPINRVSIILGKMLGAAVVAVIISTLFTGATSYYMTSFGSDEAAREAVAGKFDTSILARLDLAMTAQSFAFVGIALFLAVLCALSLATLLAVFADDAKSAQMTVTPLMMLVMIPYFFGMLFDVETASLPVKIVMFAIPFSYPFLTPKAVLFGNYGLVFAGYGYMAAFAAACIAIAARIFTTDRILTAKLRFRRRKNGAG
jgi:ABC-2 type transport system permease protein